MTAWLTRPFLGVPARRWLVAAAIAVAVWAAVGWGWGLFAAAGSVFNFVVEALRRRAPVPVPEVLERDADEASGRAVTVSRQADARDAELRQREAEVRDRVRDMSDDELARELERTRRPR